mmetsp:Transcript_6230/g.13781  ORF Transcript_6230/g.13781 Transcript_6230/m.13781 type:complete len:265 (-) Transcript_6230:8-802(-)
MFAASENLAALASGQLGRVTAADESSTIFGSTPSGFAPRLFFQISAAFAGPRTSSARPVSCPILKRRTRPRRLSFDLPRGPEKPVAHQMTRSHEAMALASSFERPRLASRMTTRPWLSFINLPKASSPRVTLRTIATTVDPGTRLMISSTTSRPTRPVAPATMTRGGFACISFWPCSRKRLSVDNSTGSICAIAIFVPCARALAKRNWPSGAAHTLATRCAPRSAAGEERNAFAAGFSEAASRTRSPQTWAGARNILQNHDHLT